MNKIAFLAAIALLAVVGAVATSPAKAPVTDVASTEATVAIKSVALADSLAAAGSRGARVITWETTGYPAGLGVNVNLIRKTSESPAAYELVRAIAVNEENDGQLIWTPQDGEEGSDLYIEITCSSTVGDGGCRVASQPASAF